MATTMNNLVQALSLDMSILQVLLKRHRCSHGRAIYFRRISMVVQALQRAAIVDLGPRMEELEKSMIGYSQAQKRKQQQNPKQEYWDHRRSRASTTATTTTNLTPEELEIQSQYTIVQCTCIESISQLLSRIEHASDPLFLEVSRGFFLPFCSVALSALARIRTLLLRIGRRTLVQLQQLVLSTLSTLNESLTTMILPEYSKDILETTIVKYMEADQISTRSCEGGVGMVSNEQRRSLLAQTFGLTLPKSTKKRKETPKTPVKKETIPNSARDEESSESIQPTATTTMSATVLPTERPLPDHEDNDVGESVIFSDKGVAAKPKKSSKSQRSIHMPNIDVMDRNMEVVANFKDKSSKKPTLKTGNERKSMKRKEDQLAHSETTDQDKKKRKKKKKGKGDFFDALFA